MGEGEGMTKAGIPKNMFDENGLKMEQTRENLQEYAYNLELDLKRTKKQLWQQQRIIDRMRANFMKYKYNLKKFPIQNEKRKRS